MEKEFVPYELAVKLKELGYKADCHFKEYDTEGFLQHNGLLHQHELEFIEAPLWQQAFNWFRDIKGLPVSIGLTIYNKGYTFLITNLGKISKVDHLTFPDKLDYGTYEQARLACLEKLIELITKND